MGALYDKDLSVDEELPLQDNNYNFFTLPSIHHIFIHF